MSVVGAGARPVPSRKSEPPGSVAGPTASSTLAATKLAAVVVRNSARPAVSGMSERMLLSGVAVVAVVPL